MRIITGSARGKRLVTVPGNDLVRPTSEKVKEGIFSSIQFDIEGRRVLDLFAGCGQMGIEALSRGADRCTFVDASKVSLDTVRTNLKGTDFEDNATLIRSDYSMFTARSTDKFDIAFLDPPYHADILEKALTSVCRIMSDYGIIVCEHPSDITLPESIMDFSANRLLRYGKINVTIYRKAGERV